MIAVHTATVMQMPLNKSLEPTNYSSDSSTLSEDGRVLDCATPLGIVRSRLNSTLFGSIRPQQIWENAMAGYFLYTIDNAVFSQLTSSPTKQQGDIFAGKLDQCFVGGRICCRVEDDRVDHRGKQ